MARAGASEEKLYKIGEVCKTADLQPYVLRYWETEFPQLSPNKSGGGQRLYTKRELEIILRIKELLYRDGFTIAGAKKKLESDMSEAAAAPPAPAPSAAPRSKRRVSPDVIGNVKKDLRAILAMLDE
jgi:DNA-binding transcriptional MerR regulator